VTPTCDLCPAAAVACAGHYVGGAVGHDVRITSPASCRVCRDLGRYDSPSTHLVLFEDGDWLVVCGEHARAATVNCPDAAVDELRPRAPGKERTHRADPLPRVLRSPRLGVGNHTGKHPSLVEGGMSDTGEWRCAASPDPRDELQELRRHGSFCCIAAGHWCGTTRCGCSCHGVNRGDPHPAVLRRTRTA
jgi:hypothetical protein